MGSKPEGLITIRFISHIRRQSVVIQAGRSEVLPGGIERPILPTVIAQFQPSDVTADEIEFAKQTFENEMHGRTYEQDEVTPTPILNRLSTFDTETPAYIAEWERLDEEYGPPKLGRRTFDNYKQFVEERLLERSGPSTDIRLVAPVKVEAPWPRYLEFAGSFEDLVQRVVDDGYDVANVLAFERQTVARPEVIELYEMVIRDQEAKRAAEAASGEFVPA